MAPSAMEKDSTEMISVERHSSFQDVSGNLLYSEYWPEHEHQNKQICNCTQEVKNRPHGTPYNVNQDIKISGESWQFSLGDMWLNFRWDQSQHDPHAYFMFGNEGRSVRIELTEYGAERDSLNLKMAFFGNLYRGNQIDTSELMNGHSVSRIIDLSKIGPQDIWMHHCCFGDEAMADVPEPESTFWRGVLSETEDISRVIQPYLKDQKTELSVIHERVKQLDKFLLQVNEVQIQLSRLARMNKFQETQVFQIGAELYRKTRSKLRNKRT